MRIVTWNVNGLRPLTSRDVLFGDRRVCSSTAPTALALSAPRPASHSILLNSATDAAAGAGSGGKPAGATSAVHIAGSTTMQCVASPLKAVLDAFSADIVCFQETKLTRDQLTEVQAKVEGYDAFFSFNRRSSRGYSGVVTYCRQSTAVPLHAEEGVLGTLSGALGCSDAAPARDDADLDTEGRCIVTDHGAFVLLNVYCPCAGEDEDRWVFQMRFHAALERRCRALVSMGREVIVVGDVNLTHNEIDHCDPQKWLKESGGSHFHDHPGRKWLNNFLVRKSAGMKPHSFAGCVTASATEIVPEVVTPSATEVVTPSAAELVTPSAAEVVTPSVAESAAERGSEGNGNAHTCRTARGGDRGNVCDSDGGGDSRACVGVVVDCFRALNPTLPGAFTCWRQDTGARACNYGTRIDYILATPRTAALVAACSIWPHVTGSDHCPVVGDLDIRASDTRRHPPAMCARFMPEFQGSTQGRLTAFLSRGGAKRLSSDAAPDGPGGERPLKRTKGQGPAQANLRSFFAAKAPVTATATTANTATPATPAARTAPNSTAEVAPPNARASAQGAIGRTVAASPSREKASKLHHRGTDAAPDDGVDVAVGTVRREARDQWRALLAAPPPPPVCAGHGEPCVERVVKKEGPNFGRRFFVCCRPQGLSTDPTARCDYFAWAEGGTAGWLRTSKSAGRAPAGVGKARAGT